MLVTLAHLGEGMFQFWEEAKTHKFWVTRPLFATSATGTGLLWPALSREVEIKCVLAGSWQQQLFTFHSLGLRYGSFVLGAASRGSALQQRGSYPCQVTPLTFSGCRQSVPSLPEWSTGQQLGLG